MGDCINVAYLIKVHGETGVPWCVSASLGIVGGEVGSLGREGGRLGLRRGKEVKGDVNHCPNTTEE